MDAEHLELDAAVGLAPSAGNAFAAGEIGVDGAEITFLEVGDAGTDAEDFDTQFVTENAGVREEGLAAFEGVKVGAANANCANSHEGFACVGGGGCGEIGELEVAGLVEGNGTHLGLLYE
jgi:hypothetical protein